jgi:hypothetical protein
LNWKSLFDFFSNINLSIVAFLTCLLYESQ